MRGGCDALVSGWYQQPRIEPTGPLGDGTSRATQTVPRMPLMTPSVAPSDARLVRRRRVRQRRLRPGAYTTEVMGRHVAKMGNRWAERLKEH